MAGGAYLSIIQGDSYVFSTNVAVDGVASNLFGSDLWFYAHTTIDSQNGEEVIIEANTDSGQVTVSGNANNIITVSLNSVTTANYPEANIAYWYLRANTASGNVYTLDRGRLCVKTGFPTVP